MANYINTWLLLFDYYLIIFNNNIEYFQLFYPPVLNTEKKIPPIPWSGLVSFHVAEEYARHVFIHFFLYFLLLGVQVWSACENTVQGDRGEYVKSHKLAGDFLDCFIIGPNS